MPEINDLNRNAKFYKEREDELVSLRKKLAELKVEYEDSIVSKKITEKYYDERVESAKSNYEELSKQNAEEIKKKEKRIKDYEKKIYILDFVDKKTPTQTKQYLRAQEVIEKSKAELEKLMQERDELDKRFIEVKDQGLSKGVDSEFLIEQKLNEAKDVYDKICTLEEELDNDSKIKEHMNNKLREKYETKLSEGKEKKKSLSRIEEVRDVINNDSNLSIIFSKLAENKETIDKYSKYANMDPAPVKPEAPVEPKKPTEPGTPPEVPGEMKEDWSEEEKEKWKLQVEKYEAHFKQEAIYKEELDKYKADLKKYNEENKDYEEKLNVYNAYKDYHSAKKNYESGLSTVEIVGISREEAEKVLNNTKFSKETGKFENTKSFNELKAKTDKDILLNETIISKIDKENVVISVVGDAKNIPEEEPLPDDMLLDNEDKDDEEKDDEERALALVNRKGFFGRLKEKWSGFLDRVFNLNRKNDTVVIEDPEEKFEEEVEEVEEAEEVEKQPVKDMSQKYRVDIDSIFSKVDKTTIQERNEEKVISESVEEIQKRLNNNGRDEER